MRPEPKRSSEIQSEPDALARPPLARGAQVQIAPVRASCMRGDSVFLGNRAWSPINTQNTAIHRDVIVSYYFVRMGYPLGGMAIDRFGDIVSGYFSQACVRHLASATRRSGRTASG